MKKKDRQYEQMTRAIYQQILNQEMAQTVSVDHDVSVEGLTTKHQIDVYWEFKLGGVPHRVLVQAKNWNTRVSKGAVLTFKGVLDDIPGTVGVIVTAKGYQKGALEVASGYGITVCLLKEVENRVPFSVSPGDSVTLAIKGVRIADGKPYAFAMEAYLLELEFSKWTIQGDPNWFKGQNIPESLTSNCISDFAKVELHDEDGKSKGNLQQVRIAMRQEVRAEFNKSGKVEGRHTHSFEDPTYLNASALPKPVKVLNVSVDYLVKPKTLKWDSPLNNVALFILENVKDNTALHFIIRHVRDGPNPTTLTPGAI
jgi:Restriction endonuclease